MGPQGLRNASGGPIAPLSDFRDPVYTCRWGGRGADVSESPRYLEPSGGKVDRRAASPKAVADACAVPHNASWSSLESMAPLTVTSAILSGNYDAASCGTGWQGGTSGEVPASTSCLALGPAAMEPAMEHSRSGPTDRCAGAGGWRGARRRAVQRVPPTLGRPAAHRRSAHPAEQLSHRVPPCPCSAAAP